MEGFSIERILEFVLALIAFFTAMTFHEYAHARVAYRLGDPTAKDSGRLTLNPLAHIDIMGTVILPIALAFLGLPVFGWAKPVPINPFYFRRPYQGMMFVAIAGPITNILMAVGLSVTVRLLDYFAFPGLLARVKPTIYYYQHPPLIAEGTPLLEAFVLALGFWLALCVIINVLLAVFNMIPIPPLDGSRVLTHFLPDSGKEFMHTIERLQVGFLLIVGLLFLGALDLIIGPIFFGAGKLFLGF